LEYPGALYHVTSRGNEKKKIFLCGEDRLLFLGIMRKVIKKFKWMCHAYCLMDNHYHLLIETPEANLSEGMRQLNGVYTQKFNHARKRVGHLLQGRFKSVLVQKESHLLGAARYVVLNPVRAKIVNEPSKWEWSSYNATAGLVKAPEFLCTDWLLGQFGRTLGQSRRAYEIFVHDGIGVKTIWKGLKAKSVLGEAGFITKIMAMMEDRHEISNIPRFQRHMNRPSLEELASTFNLEDGVNRKKFIEAAVNENGFSQSSVARLLGIHQSTVCRMLKEPD
jgi:putative transposase